MRILHTESSRGWGGQEIRILREAMGMRQRGHEVVIAVNTGGALIERARAEGFTVYELPFTKLSAIHTLLNLIRIIKSHKIDLINTHSSLDAWIGGIAAKISKKKVIRTRHLSTSIRKGLNSRLLYDHLADFVVTTSSGIIPTIERQAKIASSRLKCIPTGIDPSQIHATAEEIAAFRTSIGVKEDEILIGTACFVRSWKGIVDFLKAADLLREHKKIKWVVVGGGHVDQYLSKISEFNLEGIATFTGHLESPFAAIAAMDVFALLSTAHEGVSQASLQAAYLERPLVTTTIGGLPEVCLDGVTGLLVPPASPDEVAKAVLTLSQNASLRRGFGIAAKKLVQDKFIFTKTLEDMERIITRLK